MSTSGQSHSLKFRRVVSITGYHSTVLPFTNMLDSFLIDTWQYSPIRAMHMNAFLYKTIHSWYHRLYVSFAYGGQYNHLVKGFRGLDPRGVLIAEWLSGMSTRQAMLLFAIATFKAIDDHCGYSLPFKFDPLQWFTGNDSDYHDIHRQVHTL